MKKIILSLAMLCCTVAGFSQAQTTRKSVEPSKETYISDEERETMRVIREEGRLEKEAIMNDKSLTEAQRSAKLKDLKKRQEQKRTTAVGKARNEEIRKNRKAYHSKKTTKPKAKKDATRPAKENKEGM